MFGGGLCGSGGFGIGHEVDEAVEEVRGIVRAGSCLRVVLDREGRDVEAGEAFDDVVVQGDVADFHPAVTLFRRHRGSVQRRVHCEAVVLGSNFHLPGAAVHHRLVDAAVAVAELVRAKAQRPAQDLVAETDSEVRQFLVQHRAQQGNLVVGGSGVAGSVGHEETVGLDRVDVLQSGRGRQDVYPHAALGEAHRSHCFDAEVHCGDGEAGFALPAVIPGFNHVGLVDGDFFGQGCALHGCAGEDGVQQFLVSGLGGLAREDTCPHGLVLAEVAGDGTRVNALDAHDSLLDEFFVKASLGAPVGGPARGIADNVPRNPDAAGFSVFAVDAGVADVRRCLHDELTGVRGIGDGLLVAGHSGGEDGLSQSGSLGAVAAAAEHAAVFEHQYCC